MNGNLKILGGEVAPPLLTVLQRDPYPRHLIMLYDMFKGRVFYYGKGPRCFKGVGLLGEQNKNERGKRPCEGNHPKEERQNQEDGEIVI